MKFSTQRVAKLAGLLRESKEVDETYEMQGTDELDEMDVLDGDMHGEVDEMDVLDGDMHGEMDEMDVLDGDMHGEMGEDDQYYEVDETSMQELEESFDLRKAIRSEITRALSARDRATRGYTSGQVFGRTTRSKPGTVTMGFPGIGFKR